MADLSGVQRAALAHLIERCPDRILSQLLGLAGAMAGDRAGAMREMVEVELLDRRRRDVAFGPLAPLFHPREDGLGGLDFPADLLVRLWRAATRGEPELLPQLDRDDDLSRMVADRLCHSAAVVLRDAPDVVWPDVGPERVETMAACLDLAPVMRRALPYLPAWIGRPGVAELAELKLALRQASAVGPGGVERLLEIVFAHMPDARLMLRVLGLIGASGREAATGREEADRLIDRVVSALAQRAAEVVALNPAADENEHRRLAAGLNWCAETLAEIDVALSLGTDSVWAKAVRQARLKIALRLSEHFAAAEKAVDAVLPVERTALAGRMTRPTPRLDQAPDLQAAAKARALLALTGQVRDITAVFGCEAERRQTAEALTGRLATWADEAIERLNDGRATDEVVARKRIGLTAELLGLLGARDASRTVRRRLAIAGSNAGAASRASPPAA
ncbi:hypothetical protein ABC365_15825 [Brevundimonas sp. 3P9-tot-E]|jgi:hypothetical protein|uniref:hypothetical protein n=1 Tax=Brevundimonas TaxID=41275 RepID=UPI00190737C1|nr:MULTISPECIES: hypothetical protein [Brevundimonas]MBK1969135.1 hypothetical protein [Brevundimonas diminuta]MBK1974440.1 hypothetical protein [Brevundimonas diminuta]MDA0744334.1 hypothetical protein [Pseudomonadota bacterium]